jgi:Tol biopolymer transport system component
VGILLAFGAPSAVATPVGTESQNQTDRVSLDANGDDANGDAEHADISATGRYVVYESDATDVVAGAPRAARGSVYLFDRVARTTTLVSMTRNGTPIEGSYPKVSADGRYVVFYTGVPLLSADRNDRDDVYRRDTVLGVTRLVSVNLQGVASSSSSVAPEISDDGRWVAFQSAGDDLVEGVAMPGENNSGFVRDMVNGTTALATPHTDGSPIYNVGYLKLSADGRHVLFLGDHVDGNRRNGAYVRDLDTGDAIYASITSDGSPADRDVSPGDLDADGSVVTYHCECETMPGFPDDVITLHDLTTGDVEVVDVAADGGGPHGGFGSGGESLSADGRYVGFVSDFRNLVTGPQFRGRQVFWRDREAGVTRLVAVGHRSNAADGESTLPAITADGTQVAFESDATNLVIDPPDENLSRDIFVRKLTAPAAVTAAGVAEGSSSIRQPSTVTAQAHPF